MSGRLIIIEQKPDNSLLDVYLNFELAVPNDYLCFMWPFYEHGDCWQQLGDDIQRIVKSLMNLDSVHSLTLQPLLPKPLLLAQIKKARQFEFHLAAEAVKEALTHAIGKAAIAIRPQGGGGCTPDGT